MEKRKLQREKNEMMREAEREQSYLKKMQKEHEVWIVSIVSSLLEFKSSKTLNERNFEQSLRHLSTLG